MEDFMRRDVLFGIGLIASVAAGAGSAVAADLPVRPVAAPAAVAPVYVPDWAGFYVGIHGGGGWGNKDFESPFFSSERDDNPLAIPNNARLSGGVFGFQFGHNWQWGPVVGGLEIDFSGADLKESSSFLFVDEDRQNHRFDQDAKIDRLASVRGRLGYVIFPSVLLYGTAGIGWAHERFNSVDTEFRPYSSTTVESFRANSTFANEFGWVAGVGLEWKFWNNWLLRGEWLHYDFGKTVLVGQEITPDVDSFNVRTTVDVARAALSYKF
jgi:outer membrane immunogenic protein